MSRASRGGHTAHRAHESAAAAVPRFPGPPAAPTSQMPERAVYACPSRAEFSRMTAGTDVGGITPTSVTTIVRYLSKQARSNAGPVRAQR